MHFGLFSLMTQRDHSKSAREIFREMVDQVRLAEAIGFDIAWFAEHHFSNYCLCPSPTTMATYLAGLTERIRLGTAVLVVPLHQPLRMLEDLAVLDQLSGGRAVIGLGSGYQQYEFHKFGIAMQDGPVIMHEVLDIFEQFLAGGRITYEGKHIHIPDTYFIHRFAQKRPQVYIAGLASDPDTQGRIARNGYVPIFTTGWSTLDELLQARGRIEALQATAGGKPEATPYAIQQYIFVTDDVDEARRAAEAARYVRRISLSMRNRSAALDGAFLTEQPAAGEPSVDTLVQRMVIGSAELVAQKLASELKALRPTHISCFMALPGIEQRATLRSMELFGSGVIPRLEQELGPLDRIGVPEPASVMRSARVMA